MATFTRAFGLTLALAAPVLAHANTEKPVTSAASATEPRQIVALARGWRFLADDAGQTASQPGFDDSSWTSVEVPHSWNRIGGYGLDRTADRSNRQGIGWYRFNYDAPPAAIDQRIYLDFAAVSKIADVWVNGQHLGQHRGAFGRFRFDATSAWKPGLRNVIAVRADNSKPVAGEAAGETIPLSGDFFVHGGIYRPVSLIMTGEVGIDLLDHGGPGIYVRTDNVGSHSADIRILTRLRNGARSSRSLDVVATIRDRNGTQVAQARSRVRLKPGAGETEAMATLPTPRLWNGRTDPYLYTATVEVLQGGRVIDTVTQTFGVRNFRFDANQGFFLNDRHVKLHGVSRHQDRPDKGWALSAADAAEDMALIAEMGANTVRQAHYQHADEWSAEADRAGMVVWAELPYVTSPSVAGGKGSQELWANAEEQLRELIRQNWNHPSIMMWSVGNEVDSANGFGQKAPVQPLALLQHLNAVAKQEDPTRPTTFADCCEDLSMVQTAGEKLAGTADLIGYNRYFGWYYPKPLEAKVQLGAQMDRFHAKHPTLPISISEYGAGGAVTQHSDDVRSGFLNFMGRPQPEEFESYIHELNWPVIRDRNYIFASWVWNMFDFASDLRGEGDSFDLNTKGLVTADRKVRKDAFWYYKAQWSSEPGIYLTEKRYVERAYPVMAIKAYSNAESASLTLNGEARGKVSCLDRVCIWPDVALSPGANRVEVSAVSQGQPVNDSAIWIGPDIAQGIRIEAGDLAGHVLAGKRFGSDTFVTGGAPMVLNMGGFGGRTLAAPRKVDAALPELYDYWREGNAFSYAIPVPNGRWNVTIHTFEPRPAAEGVTMSVAANGKTALTPFSVRQTAGGSLKGISRTFPVQVRGGRLQLDFAGQNGKAVVAAIEVTP